MDKSDKVHVTAKAKPVENLRAEEMTEEERLASMRAFAEEQKYIQPGGGEITPATSSTNEGGFNTVIFGNPLQGGSFSLKMGPAYEGHLGHSEWKPPEKERRSSSIKQWIDKRHEKKEEAKVHKHGNEQE